MYLSQLQIIRRTHIKIITSQITTHELAYEYQGEREGSEHGQITALLVAFAN